MSKKLSGAQRRKLNKESELSHEVLLSKVPKLTNFFTPTCSTATAPPSISSICTGNTFLPPEVDQDDGSRPKESTATDNEACDQVGLGMCLSSSFQIQCNDSVDVVAQPVSNETTTADPATWPEHLQKDQRNEIVLNGPSNFFKKDHEYPKNSDNRRFSNFVRYRLLENGERVLRKWLVYSPKSDAAFCFCCRLFDCSSKSQFGQISGFSDWKHLGDRLKSHETSPDHFKYMVTWLDAENSLRGESSINKELLRQISSEAERSKEVLRRLVEIILFLAENNIAFRGSSAKLFTKHNGNFLGLVQLLGKFDVVLIEHLRRFSNQESHVHLLSVSVQNELINLLGNEVKQNIVKKVLTAKYFSVIFDCTPDVSRKEQTSLTIRYVNEELENDGEITIEESFLSYRVAEETTGDALTNLLLEEITDCGLSMSNCRGQGYDNGANMAGVHKGVQSRILQKYPLAFFVPCGCHSLNLVVADGAKSSVKSTSLFGILQRLFTIFAGSTKRWCVISEHVQSLTVKQVCETRWEARINAVQAVRYQYAEVRDALADLSDKTDDPTTASEALSLINQMEDFSFLVCLVIWHSLLFEVNLVSKSLQAKSTDISSAVDKYNKCLEFFETFREKGFVDSIITAKEIAAELDIEPVFPEKRIRKKKRVFSYESNEEVQTSPEETFKREVFLELVNTVSTSLKSRSTQMNEHYQKWGFLDDLSQFRDKSELKKCCKELETLLTGSNGVSDINGDDLFNELLHVKSILEIGHEKIGARPKDVLRAIKKTDSRDLFTNLWVALRILLTIPVTVASAERSFSKLKLIKTYLRSTMSQDRLNSLATLSIENDEAKKIDFKNILTKFAIAKARKIPFCP